MSTNKARLVLPPTASIIVAGTSLLFVFSDKDEADAVSVPFKKLGAIRIDNDRWYLRTKD
jgi:hypothetical protein